MRERHGRPAAADDGVDDGMAIADPGHARCADGGPDGRRRRVRRGLGGGTAGKHCDDYAAAGGEDPQ
jgi:hypothetical protein